VVGALELVPAPALGPELVPVVGLVLRRQLSSRLITRLAELTISLFSLVCLLQNFIKPIIHLT